MDETDFDLFEAEYGDEMAAMEDLADARLSPSCKPKRSLNFATPSGKPTMLNDSAIEPLSDSDNNGVESEKTPVLVGEDPGTAISLDGDATIRKRKSCGGKSAPLSKRPRVADVDVDLVDDWDVSPPPSPGRATNPRRTRNVLDEINDRIMRDYDFERERVLKRIPAGDFVSVTTDEGRRFYMGVQTELQRILKSSEKIQVNRAASLLSVPFTDLKQEVLDMRRARLEEATVETIQQLGTIADETDELTACMSALWVDRYTPHGYMDLLSDESTNRTLLHWLKLWDHVVFGREVRKKEKSMKKETMFDKYQKKDYRKEQLEMEMELDSLNRPFHKVVLLCGPPGLGKTTLAHVLASHAGYKVTEINASDDRSADTFKNKIDAAIRMAAVIGADPRPNCLVIDEIDGAPQPAINQLLTLVKGAPESETSDKKKKHKAPLMRPIICICNDQYTPALRQLRSLALILNVPPTIPIKLAGRLVDICQREGLKADQSTLLALCSKTENDIRSCINTLQFFRGKKSDLQLRDVQTATFAQKDVHKGLFSVWQAIFQRPRQNKRQYVNPYDRTTMSLQEMTRIQNAQNNTSSMSRFHHIHGLASTAGEYGKVIQGMFDNFLNQNIKDPRLHGVNLASSWLCHVDMMNARIGRTQDYSFYPYIPYTMVLFHLLFASAQVNKLQFPQGDSDYRQKLMTSRYLVTSLTEEMATSVRHYLNEKSMVMDLLPPLMEIIQPSFRPINTQLYSAREKAELAQLIRVMVEYNLTYRQDKAPDGHYAYVLEPQVDHLVKFTGLKQRKQMTYSARQLVAREIDLEKMRRAEGPVSATLSSKPSLYKASVASKKVVQTDVIPNHQKKLQPKPVDEKDLVTRDFFGRRLDAATEQEPAPTVVRRKKKLHDDGAELLNRDVWYHFKEGYSNAVRRTVRIQDMI